MALPASDVFRDYAIQGVPGSGPWQPNKREIRDWAGALENLILGAQVGGAVTFTTKTQALSSLVFPQYTMAFVVADSVAANNGIYQKTGASGFGTWTRVKDLPYSFVRAVNVGAGSANAIKAASEIPVSGAAIVAFNTVAANTASPVSVQFNDGAPLTIKTITGNDIVPGGLPANAVLAGYIDGSNFRLLSDQASTAIQAAAEAARTAAEAARDLAVQAGNLAVTTNGGDVPYPSRALSAAATIGAARKYILVEGYASWGDAPEVMYQRVATQPSHNGKFRSQDRFLPNGSTDATNGGWWAIVVPGDAIYPTWFGAKSDGTTDDTAALQSAIDVQASLLVGGLEQVGSTTDVYTGSLPAIDLLGKRYKISAALVIGSYFRMRGQNGSLIQANSSLDIINGLGSGPYTGAYQVHVQGVNFVGGRVQLNLANYNTDTTIYTVRDCQFHLSSSYAISTSAISPWAHLSADLHIEDCVFSRVNKVLNNCCDKATVRGGWIHVGKENFTAGSAAFQNKGELASTGNPPPRLHLENVMCIPTMGSYGTDRVAGARWVDNYGIFSAKSVRFGGEDAGMAIVNHLGTAATTNFVLATAILIEGCDISAGPSADPASGVVLLSGEMPNLTRIKSNVGPIGVPFIVNAGVSVTPTYFANWSTATGRRDFEGFTIDIDGNISYVADGAVIDYGRIPSGFERFVKRDRVTVATRSTSQSIGNAASVSGNIVVLDGMSADNFGAWVSSSPDRLSPQRGAARVRMVFTGSLSSATGGTFLTVEILNQTGAVVGQQSLPVGANPDGISFTLTCEASYTPGAYFRANIRHNSSGPITLAAFASFSIRPINFVS